MKTNIAISEHVSVLKMFCFIFCLMLKHLPKSYRHVKDSRLYLSLDIATCM